MNRIVLLLSFVLLANLGFSQTAGIDHEPHNPGWEVDLMKAYEMSQKTGKPILANFTGSDWCGWCIRLTRAVFAKDDFKKWADENVVLLELDFPRRSQLPAALKTQNSQMQQALQVRGYPSVWLLTLEKDEKTNQMKINPMGKTGYKATVAEFTKSVEIYMKGA